MEHSKNFEKIKKYYDTHAWNKEMVYNAIGKWITEEEYIEIVGYEDSEDQDSEEVTDEGNDSSESNN